MSSIRRTPFAACRNSRGGFTLVELLVVIGIIAILAGVALGPITSGIKTAQHNAGMQGSRSIALLCFQYSIDNGVYPSGTNTDSTTAPGGNTSEGVAQQLLSGKYTSDPTIFYTAAPGKSKYIGAGSGGTFSDFAANNVAWDFTALASPSVNGITSSASDLLPVVWGSGNAVVTYPAGGGGVQFDLPLQNTSQFGQDGVAVTYKSNSATFIKGTTTGGTSVASSFIAKSYNDTNTYKDISP